MENNTHYHLFKDRTALLYHRTPLVALGKGPAFGEYLEQTRKVFGHQIAVYPGTEQPWTDTQKLAMHFYTKCYSVPSFLRSQTDYGAQVTVDEFVKDTFLHKPLELRNRTRFMIGDVGIGKTAFINYLISRQFMTHVNSGDMWFIRADIEDYSKGAVIDITAEDFVVRLLEHAKEVLARHPSLTVHDKVKPHYEDFLSQCPVSFPTVNAVVDSFAKPVAKTKATEAFKSLVLAIYRHTGRRLSVVIDNVDKYMHHRDSNLFDSNEATGDEGYIEDMIRCLYVFSHDHALGSIGANILFISRPDTYNILCDLETGTSLQPSIAQPQKRDAYVLPATLLKTVLESRLALLEYAANLQETEGRRQHFASVTNRVKHELLDGNFKGVETLYKLCNHGYRQLMDYFSRYGWTPHVADGGGEEILEKFVHNTPVALLSFMLGEVSLYSQFISKFPNIYLVRHLPTAGQKISDLEAQHSYWLKRMICELLYVESSMTKQQVVEILANAGNGFYSAKLCEILLGSLCHVDCSNTLTVVRELHPHDKHKLRISSISLSHRGKICVEEIFDSFIYLQLIVDDFDMYIPRVVADVFPLSTAHVKHYGYLVEKGRVHFDHTQDMIRHKARQVLVFLEVLRHSLSIEQLLYPKAFERFNQVVTGNRLNVGKVRESVLNELVRISNTNGKFLDVSKYASEAEGKSQDIHKQLKIIYGLS